MAVSAKHDELITGGQQRATGLKSLTIAVMYERGAMRRAQRQKAVCKAHEHHLFHSVRYPFGRPTIVREVR